MANLVGKAASFQIYRELVDRTCGSSRVVTLCVRIWKVRLLPAFGCHLTDDRYGRSLLDLTARRLTASSFSDSCRGPKTASALGHKP